MFLAQRHLNIALSSHGDLFFTPQSFYTIPFCTNSVAPCRSDTICVKTMRLHFTLHYIWAFYANCDYTLHISTEHLSINVCTTLLIQQNLFTIMFAAENYCTANSYLRNTVESYPTIFDLILVFNKSIEVPEKQRFAKEPIS